MGDSTKIDIPDVLASPMVDPLVAYVDSNLHDYVGELAALVRKPSVSATGAGVDDCARYLADRIEAYGLQAELFEVEGGHPVIVARALGRDEDRCLLIYDHYDVQPVEPLEKWDRDPFSGGFLGTLGPGVDALNVEFYDGLGWWDDWDSREELPLAVCVTLGAWVPSRAEDEPILRRASTVVWLACYREAGE